MKIKKKTISLILSIAMLFQSLLPYGLVISVHAQEADPTPTVESTSLPETTPSSSIDPSPTSTPDVAVESPSTSPSPDATLDPTVVASPTPTIPPYWSDDYEAYKAQREADELVKEQEEAAREAREDEWDANKDNSAWVAAHGGDRSYFISGNWQKDEDARKAAEAAAAAEAARIAQEEQAKLANDALNNSPASDPISDDPSAVLTGADNINDPCSSSEGNNLDGSTLDTSVGTTDSLAQAVSETNIGVANNNCLNAGNTGTASGTSGENNQTQNDGSTNMSTGGSSADGTMVNTGNVNTTEVSGGSGNATAVTGESLSNEAGGEDMTQGTTAENLNTGEDTNNLAEASNSETLGVTNTNEAYVNNELNVQGTSGSNIVTENDGDATLTTGDVELIANMLNILNLNITGEDFMHLIINIFGTLDADLDINEISLALGLQSNEELQVIARNDATEEDSSNTANATNTTTTAIDNNNTAVVNNTMNVDGVSGQNTVSGNDGDVDVVTGRIKILANLMNFINTNFSGEKWSFIMINIFGKLNGDIMLPDTANYTDGATGTAVMAENTNSGDGTAVSQATSTDTTNVTNNNDVILTNDVNANGISGANTQNYNDEAGTTNAGEVDVVTQLTNFLNFNITGDNWVFLVVNVFGKWMGKIVNFAGKDMAAPTDGTFAAMSVGQSSGTASEVSAINDGGNNNTATASNTQTTDINNDNSAVVNNDLNINGISGQNGLNGNDGTTSLTTGWVDIDANLLNIINMNVAGRQWMIVFLNIFGDFAGDLFFGERPQAVTETADAAGDANADTKNKENVDFSMGDPATSSNEATNSNSNTNGESANNNSSQAVVATVMGTRSFKGGSKMVKKAEIASAENNNIYYSNVQTDVQDENMYFSFFGKKYRIPNRFKKIFYLIALKGRKLLALR